MLGFIAQLAERWNGIAEVVVGSNLVYAWIFSGFNFTAAYFACVTAMINAVFLPISIKLYFINSLVWK